MVTTEVALIAVFGATGTGKTTFINDASGGNLEVGHGSHACTQDIVQSPIFQLDGKNVVLFDTPGFDDTHLSDTEVLKRIAGFLAESYQNGYRLTGIIYLHRITDVRVGGISLRTFNVFRKLCGTESLSNVLLVTNMWSDPPTDIELEREKELRNDSDFFKHAIEEGATLVRRSHKTKESAHEIIRKVLSKSPVVMTVQTELVDEKRELSDTGAGRVIEQELRAAVEHHKKEMERVKGEMETAIREQDERTQKELTEWQKKAKAEEEKRNQEMESMKKGYGDEQAKWKKEMEEAKASRKAAEAEQKKMREELEDVRKKEREADAQHRQELQNRIGQLEQEIANKPGCIIG